MRSLRTFLAGRGASACADTARAFPFPGVGATTTSTVDARSAGFVASTTGTLLAQRQLPGITLLALLVGNVLERDLKFWIVSFVVVVTRNCRCGVAAGHLDFRVRGGGHVAEERGEVSVTVNCRGRDRKSVV